MQDAAFWDRIAPRYARSPVRNEAAYEATLDRVRGYLNAHARVLEAGCGTGSTALKLAGQTAQYIGTDISPAMIDIARSKAAEAGIGNLSFKVADADAVIEPPGLDVVLGLNLLHLVRDLDAVVASAYDSLAPGGYYITKTPCLREMNPLLRLALPVMRLIGKAPFVLFLDRRGLEQAITRAGFEIVSSETFDGAPATPCVVAQRPAPQDPSVR